MELGYFRKLQYITHCKAYSDSVQRASRVPHFVISSKVDSFFTSPWLSVRVIVPLEPSPQSQVQSSLEQVIMKDIFLLTLTSSCCWPGEEQCLVSSRHEAKELNRSFISSENFLVVSLMCCTFNFSTK